MGIDVAGHRLLPMDENAGKIAFKCVADETITKNAIVFISGSNGTSFKVQNADADVQAEASGILLVAIHDAASGKVVRCKPIGTMRRVNTNGATIGDPVYLSATAGSFSLTPVGLTRKVGEVTAVSATVGKIAFDGLSISSGHRFQSGTGAVADGETTATITAATLGGTYGGKNVFVTVRETATNSVSLRSATWSTNDLVVTVSGDPGASGADFNYLIQVAP